MMSDPIVIELQRLSADKSHDIGDLLRKSLIVATKLRIDDFKTWINCELNGYEKRADVPEYRRIPTQLKAVNRWRGGLDPITIADPEISEIICRLAMTESIAQLQGLVDSSSGMFHLTLTSGELGLLSKMFRTEMNVEVVREGSRISLVGVVDSVRNLILEWALRLEEQGILGHGMTFTSEEKAKAMTSQNIHISSFQGILGDVADSTVTQNLNMTIKAGDFNSLSRQLAEAGVDSADIKTLEEAIQADPKPTSAANLGPKVSGWFGNMMAKAASGAWKVSLDTAGKLIPAAIAAYYGLKG